MTITLILQLLPIVAAIVSVAGAWAVTGWRMSEVERRLQLNETADKTLANELQDLRLHVAQNYATDEKIQHLEDKLEKIRDQIIAAMATTKRTR
jgi:uncharacterized protein HemX